MPNFNDCEVTHILVSCPRGFVNERSVYAIPADMAQDAKTLADSDNPHGDARLSYIAARAEANRSDIASAARSLSQFDTLEEYREFMYFDGPLCSTISY